MSLGREIGIGDNEIVFLGSKGVAEDDGIQSGGRRSCEGADVAKEVGRSGAVGGHGGAIGGMKVD